ncbi:putative 2OG-Fe(II) oxygenase [Actinomadura terrae]|uniref:putative 2OG-Fe(II) oxygenase n=1 Tax=Actinomadura terrae TaxID=604353 RepID=UPI001FA6E246|nr:putative 2OG-Fe(II) oxygenase [Actinomadura terrae]
MTETSTSHDPPSPAASATPEERLVLEMWRTPVYQADCTGAARHLPDLRTLILDGGGDGHADGPGGPIASPPTMLTRDHPSIDWLRHEIGLAGRTLARAVLGEAADEIPDHEVHTEAWALVCRPGEPFRPHTRHDAAWSGLLSVAADPSVDADAGHLELLDPRPAAVTRDASPGAVHYTPVPGRMIAFPGWQANWMRATTTHLRLRVAIAWNIVYHQPRSRTS